MSKTFSSFGFVFFYKKKAYKNSQNHNDLLFSSYNVTV